MPETNAKEILHACQQLFNKTKGKKITPSLQKLIASYRKKLTSTFSITDTESLIFSFVLLETFREREVSIDELVKHYGNDFSLVPEFNAALESLKEKKIFSLRPGSIKRRKEVGYRFTVNHRIVDALMKGDLSLIQVESHLVFYDMLQEVSSIIDMQDNDVITSCELIEELEDVLNSNRQFQQVDWLLKHSLTREEQTMFFIICCDTVAGNNVTDIDELLKKVFHLPYERLDYKRSIKDKTSKLLEKELITFDPNNYGYFEGVSLSENSQQNILFGDSQLLKKSFKPKLALLINHQTIVPCQLYYNPAENEQVQVLNDALEQKAYQELTAQLKKNGLGTGFTVLLHGAAGTGKTATVKEWARQTGRNILMVEVDKIKSAWVGESEKHLNDLFQEYKRACTFYEKHPILLFNEADAILGKRMQVKSSVDQMNNSIQNILLQQLEDFEGIFVATTNLAEHLDNAFDRRLLYKIEFKAPEKPVQQQIWSSFFPELEQEILRNIHDEAVLTGGQIMNVKRKLLVNNILRNQKTTRERLMIACREERSLNNNKHRSAIGFRG
ncbi:MAG: ATP-binding protein [bacterium]